MSSDGLVNEGVILRPGQADPSQPPTFIVTGVGRGGTSLIAGLLAEAGVYMGQHLSELTHEDTEILHILRGRDDAALNGIIARRNALGRPWGFKAPVLSSFLRPPDLARFRNLHLLAVFRDPIAIAVRHAMAEYESSLRAAVDSARAMSEIALLVEQTNVPALMLSYEKFTVFPEATVDKLMAFCGFGASPDLRQRLLGQVRPNNQDYATRYRRAFNGNIDGLIGTILYGWCWDQNWREQFNLDIRFNGTKVAETRSDKYRRDLGDAGIGDGHHGFVIDLAPLRPRPDTVVSVNVAGKTYMLPRGDKPLSLIAGYEPSRFGAVPSG
jgi:hypothetical protein